MLRTRENERLTRVGPGTPMGDLLRRYWHPIAASAELAQEPTKAVRILGESLVLYKDRSGTLGLIQEACAHRRVNMLYGIPEPEGLRCPYHGWLYNQDGQCLETPAEAPDSTFKDRIRIIAYPVQELGGLIWAYLGPEPVPLLPRWDLFVQDGLFRDIGGVVVPCNWLQIMENTLDPVHLEYLHGRYGRYLLERQGVPPDEVSQRLGGFFRHHVKIGFDVFELGIIKRRLYEGDTEEAPDWRIGHPLIFPNILRMGDRWRSEFHIRVPMDDTHTWHVWYIGYNPGPGVEMPKQESVPFFQVPLYDPDGQLVLDYAEGQDIMTWVTAGQIVDRSLERLAESDKGIILYRRLLNEQVKLVEDGGEPMNVFRDPVTNVTLTLPFEESRHNRSGASVALGLTRIGAARFSQVNDQVRELFARAAKTSPTGGSGSS